MGRMKTFLIYFVLFIGFFALSLLLEHLTMEKAYKNITSTGVVGKTTEVDIIVDEVRATNVNGYLNFKVKNNTSENVENTYIKVDLKNKQNLIAVTEYVTVNNLKGNEERSIKLKFKANNIERYEMRMVDEAPYQDPWYILNFFGIRIDLSNVFGLDLRNIVELFEDGCFWFLRLAAGVPKWGYFVGAVIILMQMPKKFLFGIFPF